MGAPQITLIVLYTLSIGLHLAKHGQPRTGNHSFFTSIIGVGIVVCILQWGGFWS